MLKKFFLPLVIVGTALLTFMFLKVTQPERPSLERPERAWLVNTQSATFETLSPQLTMYGRVETPSISTLTTSVEAFVEQINVLEGSRVSAGDLLIVLDDSDVRLMQQQRLADVDEAESLVASELQRYQRDQRLLDYEKSLLQLAEKAVERAKTLELSRLAAQATVDEATATLQRQNLTLQQLEYDVANHPQRLRQLRASLRRAEAALAQTELDLQRTRLHSPFDGRIARLEVAVGDRAREGQSLIAIYDLGQLEIRAQIPGRFVSSIRQLMQQGRQLEATAVIDGQSYPLTLDRLAGEIKADTGGIEGLFRFTAAGEAVSLGQFAELHLQLPAKTNVIALPFSALYGLDRIYRVIDGKLEAVTVERVGEYRLDSGQSKILIRSDSLRQGDQIVTTQLPNAINGLRVTSHAE